MAAKSGKAATRAGIRIGTAPRAEGGSGGLGYWNVKDGETHDLTILANIDEIVSVDQFALWEIQPAAIWVSIGSDDPGYELGLKKPGYKAFVPVAMKDDEGNVVTKIWAVGIKIHRDLCEIAEMNDGLKDAVIRVKRSGKGMSTRYTVMPTTKKPLEVDDIPTTDEIIETLGPDTREGVIELLVEKAGMSYERILEKYSSIPEDDAVAAGDGDDGVDVKVF